MSEGEKKKCEDKLMLFFHADKGKLVYQVC
jgi:hypothetical protein